MRWTPLLAVVGCAGEPGGAQVVLDIPNGVLDPAGYTTVEITLRDAAGHESETQRAAVLDGGVFDLGELAPQTGVSIEAVLRSESGAAVGYGRTATAVDLESDATIAVPVRRPIVYIAGVTNSYETGAARWSPTPATFSDLSSGVVLDGTTLVAEKPVLMIAAGPELYAVDQPVVATTGALTGAATIRAVSTADHSMAAPIAGELVGAVQDGVGSDDGATLVIGTREKLYAVDTRVPAMRELAVGDFARVAIVARADGTIGALAIKNRGSSSTATCSDAAELWWIADARAPTTDARMLAAGGFADVASDAGRAWYVDACKGELGEATDAGIAPVRGGLGRATALAVANGQAWLGIEAPAPATLSLQVVSLAYPDGAPRTLWSEEQEQVLAARQFPTVQRRLTATFATFQQLEIGTGGDYIAIGTAGLFEGPRVPEANFPRMQLDTEELRVFDAASGGVVQRYQSWCDGFFEGVVGEDILSWRCATTTGQTAPPPPGTLAHRVGSLTFLFGKK